MGIYCTVPSQCTRLWPVFPVDSPRLLSQRSFSRNPPPKPQPKPKTKPQEKKLPPKPEEKWRYIEELKNKEVPVEAKKEQKPSRPYLMQCGAYRSQDQAEQRKAMIAFQGGLTSQVKVSQGEKGNWYRVILGPYPQKRKAESDRNMLRRAGIEPCAIWFWE